MFRIFALCRQPETKKQQRSAQQRYHGFFSGLFSGKLYLRDMRLLILLFLFPCFAVADTVNVPSSAPLTAQEFEAYTTGKTLTYARQGGSVYGIEEYLPERRVRWAFSQDECRFGTWFEELGQICFVYDHAPSNAQCWSFYRTDGGLLAQFENDPDQAPIYEVQQSETPLQCPGPLVGV